MIATTLLTAGGCQTWHKSHEAALISYSAGDLTTSREALAEAREKFRAEQQLLELDQGMLDLAAGEPTQAETKFRHLREELDHLAQKDVAESATAVLSDSRAIAWSGREFERQMLLNMALLSSLVGDRQDSFAWSMQVADTAHARQAALKDAAQTTANESQLAMSAEGEDAGVEPVSHQTQASADSLKLNAPASDQALAFGSWLSAIVQSEQPTRSQETQGFLESISVWNPAFAEQQRRNLSSKLGVQCQSGQGAVQVIALVGRSPAWVSESAEPTSAALLIADRIVSATGKHTLPPTIAAVKIARPEPSHPSSTVSLKCAVRSEVHGSTRPLLFATLVDLNAVAQSHYEQHRDQEIAKAISRRVLKKGAVYLLKESQKVHRNSLVDLGINVAGVAWEAMEKADTRSWRLLPGRVEVASVELPVGSWSLQLHTQATVSPQTHNVDVEDGRNTVVVVVIPEDRPRGHVLIRGVEQRAISTD